MWRSLVGLIALVVAVFWFLVWLLAGLVILAAVWFLVWVIVLATDYALYKDAALPVPVVRGEVVDDRRGIERSVTARRPETLSGDETTP